MKKREIFLLIGIIVGIALLVLSVVLISKFAPDTINHRWFNRETENSESSTTTNTEDSNQSNNSNPDNTSTPEKSPSSAEDTQSKDTVDSDTSSNKKPNENSNSDTPLLDSEKPSDTSNDATNAVSNDNSSNNSSETAPAEDGLSKNTAWNIETNMEYTATMLQSNQTHWFSFATSSEDVVHRIYIDPNINENHSSATWYIYIYNENGILLYENFTSRFVEEHFFDVFLSVNSKYYIKISAAGFYKDMDNYMLGIKEIARDPSTVSNKEDAMVIGTEITYTGYLNTSFSNWYTCTFLEEGKYMFEFHNIDVGDTVSYVGKTPGDNIVVTGIAYNENNDSKMFTVTAGQQLYIEIDSTNRNVNGKYMFIIKKVA